MIFFAVCIFLLLAGYFVYGRIIEKIFRPDSSRVTPSTSMNDGVDYVPISNKKVFLIQLLNIAGLGPIFGPILGALYGPSAMLWIVIGCIFGGAVHDYFSGMLSIRSKGASLPTIAGKHLGSWARIFMNYFSVIVLLLVGVVFVLGPAKLLGSLFNDSGLFSSVTLWCAIIFLYYMLATIIPIDKIIGRIYPFFGALLVFMTVGLLIGLIVSGHTFFQAGLVFTNMNPTGSPMWPLLFITIACGAVSGFHATQSPMMARCIKNEKSGRAIFYGAMIAEGIIALIWCTLGLSFYKDPAALNAVLAQSGPGGVVNQISTSILGNFGGILAILGVVILPITSGDTAFRSARLIVSEFFKLPQKAILNRLYIAIPLFIIGYFISEADFGVIWRYFGWANQTLAMVMLWTAAAYLIRSGKFHWVATIPATFMTAVTFTYILNAKIGLQFSMFSSIIIGIIITIIAFVAFFIFYKSPEKEKKS